MTITASPQGSITSKSVRGLLAALLVAVLGVAVLPAPQASATVYHTFSIFNRTASTMKLTSERDPNQAGYGTPPPAEIPPGQRRDFTVTFWALYNTKSNLTYLFRDDDRVLRELTIAANRSTISRLVDVQDRLQRVRVHTVGLDGDTAHHVHRRPARAGNGCGDRSLREEATPHRDLLQRRRPLCTPRSLRGARARRRAGWIGLQLLERPARAASRRTAPT